MTPDLDCAPGTRDCTVVLLPGLWMPAWVMIPLERRLARSGFATLRFDYASARADLTENARRLARFVEASGSGRIHLVGHSLGGVLALHATACFALERVHRVVMLGSPYRDSHAARQLARSGWGRRIIGRTVPDWLVAARHAVPHPVEVGVIAGTVAFGLGALIVRGLPRPHDGVVSVEETVVSGMRAAAQVGVGHSQMLVSRRVGELVCRFLLHGSFQTQDARAAEAAA